MKSKKKQFLFSVVVPTLNEELFLPLLLEDLKNQTLQDFEVVHVDAKSEDDTVKKAKEFSKNITIRTISSAKRNVSIQRNLGGKTAVGQWILFMDADNRLDPDFLERIANKLSKYQDISIFSTWVRINSKIIGSKAIENVINFSLEFFYRIKREHSFGAFIGVKKEVFDVVQFDEKQKIYEDVLFIQQVVLAGNVFKLFSSPRYYYSARRIEKDGPITILQQGTNMIINELQGKDFSEEDFGYAMAGGSEYESTDSAYYNNYPLQVIKTIHNYMTQASESQKEQARKIWRKVRDTISN